MIAKISQKMIQTINTLKMLGMAWTRAFTTTRIPCILDIALRGLKARRVLMVLNAWMPPAPSKDAVKLISETYQR